MFDFEKLDVYQLVKQQNIQVLRLLGGIEGLDPELKERWKSASISILLNLAEATGRMTPADKKDFLTLSRGSVFESVAILDLVKSLGQISDPQAGELYSRYEQISKMLLGMYRSY